MAIQVGDKIPDLKLTQMTSKGLKPVSTAALFADKKVVLFGVPGAFTPTCNDTHLPGFLLNADRFKEKGVDLILCMAVNDPFVMSSWGKATNAGEHIQMLADGNGEFTRALDLELDLSHIGLGQRSKRFAAIIDNGALRLLNVEPAGDVGVSSADTILQAL
jgi:peroxiredoxin